MLCVDYCVRPMSLTGKRDTAVTQGGCSQDLHPLTLPKFYLARHVTSRHARHVEHVVSCRDVTDQVKFGIYCYIARL